MTTVERKPKRCCEVADWVTHISHWVSQEPPLPTTPLITHTRTHARAHNIMLSPRSVESDSYDHLKETHVADATPQTNSYILYISVLFTSFSSWKCSGCCYISASNSLICKYRSSRQLLINSSPGSY